MDRDMEGFAAGSFEGPCKALRKHDREEGIRACDVEARDRGLGQVKRLVRHRCTRGGLDRTGTNCHRQQGQKA